MVGGVKMEAGLGRSPWGINPELTVAPPEFWPSYLMWCFLLFKLIESRVSVTGNRSLLMNPPTLNEHMCVPGIVSALQVLLHFVLTQPHDKHTFVSLCWNTRRGGLGGLGACPHYTTVERLVWVWTQTSWLESPNLSLSTVVLFTLTFN